MSSLAIIISNFSLFPLLFLLIPIYIFRNQVSKLQSFVSNYLIQITTYMKWLWLLLIQQSLFSHRIHGVAETGEESSINQYKYKPTCNAVVECSVCLCKIEEGEEVKELRCDHLFHRDCLNRWVEYRRRNATCPICRDFIASQKVIIQHGIEVLEFKKFTTFCSRERDTWWLR